MVCYEALQKEKRIRQLIVALSEIKSNKNFSLKENAINDTCTLLNEYGSLLSKEELFKAMERDLALVRSCKVCKNWTKCKPDAPLESPEFKMWRDCGGSCKLNWKWRGL